jgi:hypothetical protein
MAAEDLGGGDQTLVGSSPHADDRAIPRPHPSTGRRVEPSRYRQMAIARRSVAVVELEHRTVAAIAGDVPA